MKHAVLMIAVAMGLAAPAWAETAPADKFGKFDMFGVMDLNGDGQVIADEAKANALTYFDKIDINKDGVVLPDELLVRAQAVQTLQNGGVPVPSNERLAEQLQARAKRQMDAIDVNGDGKVTRDEYATRAVERHQASDTNGDGYLTRDEYNARRGGIAKMKKKIHDQREPATTPPAQ